MTAAIFGLVGVLIGGLLNALMARWLENKTQRDGAKAAARLLRDELMHNLRRLELVRENPQSAEDELSRIRTEEWERQRGVLARGLTAEEFDTVSGAYADLDDLEAVAMRLQAAATIGESDAAQPDSESPKPWWGSVAAALAEAAAIPLGGAAPAAAAAAAAAARNWPSLVDFWRSLVADLPVRRAEQRTRDALAVAARVGRGRVRRIQIVRGDLPRTASVGHEVTR